MSAENPIDPGVIFRRRHVSNPAMSRSVSEKDWKVFSQLLPVAALRYSQHILDRTVQIATSAEGDAHDRYVKIDKLMRDAQRENQRLFSDFRRSTALMQIIAIHHGGWFTKEEFARFSPEIHQTCEALS